MVSFFGTGFNSIPWATFSCSVAAKPQENIKEDYPDYKDEKGNLIEEITCKVAENGDSRDNAKWKNAKIVELNQPDMVIDDMVISMTNRPSVVVVVVAWESALAILNQGVVVGGVPLWKKMLGSQHGKVADWEGYRRQVAEGGHC